MNVYLLDTNVCIRILNGTHEGVIGRFSAESPATVRLCSVVKCELLYGARKINQLAQLINNLELFFAPMASLPFDDRAAEHYGMIRADLARQGSPIGGNDLQIAAIARVHDLTLVTHNIQEFSRVVGLRVEDWEATA